MYSYVRALILQILCFVYSYVRALIPSSVILYLQIADKQQRQMTEARIAELEAEKKKEEGKLEEQKLLQELRKMEATGYHHVVSVFN